MSSEEFHLDKGPKSDTSVEIEGNELADKQPRRVRTNEEGQTERLVKYANGDFEWVPTAERETSQELDVHSEVLEEVVSAIEVSEKDNNRQDQEITELRQTLEARDEEVLELRSELDELRRMVEELRGGAATESEAEDIVDAEIIEDEEAHDNERVFTVSSAGEVTPPAGKEVELYSAPAAEVGKEVELYTDPKDEAETALEAAAEEEGFSPELSAEVAEALKDNAGDYAKLTAKARKGYLGQLLHNSKYLVKVPGLKKLADKINDWSDQKLDAARESYQGALADMQRDIQDQFEAEYAEEERGDEYENNLRLAKQLALMQSHADLEDAITAERHEQSGKAGWLTKQLTNKGSLKGKLAIAGTAAAVGAGVGLLGGGKWGGMLAGATVGGVMAGQVNRRRANSEGEDGRTLAESQSKEDRDAFTQELADKYDNDEDANVEDLIKYVQERTASERQGNRSRLKTAIGVGAAAGGLSGGIVEAMQGTVGAAPVEAPQPEVPAPEPVPEVVPEPVAEVLVPDPSIGNYDYPWNWAADTFGAEGATDTLKQLGELAAQDGHSIQWNGDGLNEWVSVDGVSDTQSVLDILSRYTTKL